MYDLKPWKMSFEGYWQGHSWRSDNFVLKNNNKEEILGVIIDRKLTFHQHIKKNFVKQVKK